LNSTRLPTHSAARNINHDIEFARGFRYLERLLRNHAMDAVKEILVDRLFVYQDLSGTWSQKYPSR
jgi:hypothetical protein